MNRLKFSILAALALCCTAAFSSAAFGDLTPGQIVNNFNAQNGGKGFVFEAQISSIYHNQSHASGTDAGETRLVNKGAWLPDLSAYASVAKGGDYFQSFCVEPEEAVAGPPAVNNGKLNYASGQTFTQGGVPQTALTVGTALLYKKFADGSLAGYNYTYGAQRAVSAGKLQDAIWFLMGKSEYMQDSSTSWATNSFLQYLLTVDSNQSAWTGAYNLDAAYAFMGDTKIFVMNVVQERTTQGVKERYRQDLLYAVNGESGTVPEPATLVLWTLGSCGVFGAVVRRFRKQQRDKLVAMA